MASEFDSDLQNTDLGKEVASWFHCWKNSTCFIKNSTCLIKLLLLMIKWLGLFSSKNHLLRSQSCIFLLNLIGALKLPQRKLESWFLLWSFFLQWLLCISINIPYELAWNIFVMSGPVYRTVGSSLATSLVPKFLIQTNSVCLFL